MATSSVHSNAFNFLSFVEAGVDSRTGQYTCSISLPELKCNALCGPALPLRLSFNPLATQLASKDRNSGFGCGWSLALSQYNPTTQMLSLSTGESFKVTGSGVQPAIREQKIESFHFYEEQGSTGPLYWVVHKSGLVEHLSPGGPDGIALPSAIYSAQGHKIELLYEVFKGGRALFEIQDSSGTVLRIVRTDAAITLHLHPDVPELGARYVMELTGSDERVSDLVLPTDEKARWHFEYGYLNDFLCVTQVLTPLGGTETLDHAVPGHQFPGSARPALPRVREHINNPGSGQPPITTRYEYSDTNFLGFGAQGLIWSDDGQDNLYKLNTPYQYTTTEILYDNAQKRDVRRIHRVFNRFHLLVSEETTQNDNVLLLENSYYADQNPNLSFDQQPAQCQLVTEVRKTWYLCSSSANKRVESTLTEFDAYGNLLVQTLPTGIREVSSYYPKEGADGCPPDPDDFVRTLKEKRVEPAQSRHDLSVFGARRRCAVNALKNDFAALVKSPRKLGEAAPTLRSVYRYSAKPTLGSTLSEWLALDSETLLQVDGNGDIELQRTETQYIDDVGEPFLFGRIKRESQTLNGQTSHIDYSYQSGTQKRGNEKAQKTTKTLSTAFTNQEANATKTVTLEHSLLSGLPLLDQDENDIEINYRYDALGRIVEEVVSPDTDYSARRLYTYKLCSQPGEKASQAAMDVNDVTVLTELDGLGRAIAEYHQNIYQPTPDFLKVQAWTYNAYGQLEQETSWDHWQPDEGQPLQALELTSAFAYNAWGAVTRTTRPDGVVEVNEFDPITLKRTAWQEMEATVVNWSETVSNGFDKPLTVRQRAGAEYLEQTYAYDGLGRCVESTDAMDNTSGFEYDAWGRLLRTQLPDMTVVSKTYAPHTREALPASVRIVPDNEAWPSVLVGEQLFDGLNRLKQLKVGPRTSHYRYTAGQMTVSECETPSQQRLQYTYDLGLTGLPTTATGPDETASFSYNPKTAQITKTRSTQGQHDFEYDLAGHLRRESWTDTHRLAGRKKESGKAEPFSVTYNSSLSGRQISRVDVTGMKTLYEHDLLGRLNSIRQGELQADFSYWPTGWLKTTLCTDLSSQQRLETALDYDDLGRETLRTLSVDGKALRSLEMTYQPDHKLATRRLCEGDTELHAETFTYDVRGRLKVYTRTPPATGALADAMIRQDFTFDSLDNITALSTTFADGRIEKATYHFNPADPCQLTEIRYDDPGKPPIRLEYDADGHLTKDEHGQVLRYDSQGRLLTVTDGAGQPVAQYRYDGHNQLISALHGQQPETLRFYQDGQLSNSLQAGEAISYLLESGRPLGQQTPGKSGQTLLLMTDATRSVIGECQQKNMRHVTYDPYGERTGDEPLQSLMAFNGEVRDAVGGWYLLGKGYRAYNPTLMRFHSPDSLSPFGAGGVNPYVYCLSDPINAVDPSGHSLKSWIGVGLGVLGIVATVVTAGGLTPVAGGVIAWGLWGAGVGTGVASGITGVMGAMEQDRQHARTLDNISIISGVLSGVFSMFSAAANFSRAGKLHGFSNAAKEGADDAAFSTSKSAGNVELNWESSAPDRMLHDITLPDLSPRSSVSSTRSAASVSTDDLTQRLTDLRGYDPISKADKGVQTSLSSPRTRSSASLSSEISVQQPTGAPVAPVSPPPPPASPVASPKTTHPLSARDNYTALRGVVPRVKNQNGLIDQVGTARAPNAHKFLPG